MPARKNRPGKVTGPVGTNPDAQIRAWATANRFRLEKTAGGYDISKGWSVSNDAPEDSRFRCAFLVYSAKVGKWVATHNIHPGERSDLYRFSSPQEAWETYTAESKESCP